MSSSVALRHDFWSRPPEEVRVVVFGATGYVGRFVVRELVSRGYQVVAFTRERSGIGGRQDRDQAIADFPGAEVCFGDVTDPQSIAAAAFHQPADVVVSCLASRTGGRQDSWAIDHDATLNTYREGRRAGAAHYVLLSAICVQKPELDSYKSKLAFEAVLRDDAEISHSIVRPTAFFKSLAGQVESCRKGAPYVMFAEGELARCKPISEQDLARFMADCIQDESKRNQVLPIGGPGPALSAREQGNMLFRALGRAPRLLSVPIAFMNGPIAVLEGLSRVVPSLQDTAEFGRIGRYYACESMLVWDHEAGRYDADATPSYGEDTLEQFFERVVRDGMAGQELGDAALF